MKKSFEELLEYIKDNATPEFNELYEKVQQENKKRNKCFFIIITIANLIIIYLLYHFYHQISFQMLFMILPILVVNLLIFVIISLCFSKYRNQYIAAFKYNVIQRILCNFYSNVDYLPKKPMPNTIYDEGKYNEYYNKYYSDDYMEGLLQEKYFVKMAEVLTQEEETHTDSDGNTTTTTTTKFHGLFAKIQMEKSLNSNLLIRQNHSFSKKARLEMDSDEFEKLFDVSATNQIIGMQILTHDIMELLVSFKKSTGISYDISIYNDILYLRFHTGSMFEFKSLKKGAYDEVLLKKYYDVLDFTYTLSKMLIELIEKTEI